MATPLFQTHRYCPICKGEYPTSEIQEKNYVWIYCRSCDNLIDTEKIEAIDNTDINTEIRSINHSLKLGG